MARPAHGRALGDAARATRGRFPAVAIVVAIVVATVLAGCEHDAAPDKAAAARSRAQVVPAAHELFQALRARSARSVELLDWGYTPCGTQALAYTISMRLFAFVPRQNTHFGAYRRQVVSIVRAGGWTLRRHLSSRSVTLPTVPSAYYRMSRQDNGASVTGVLSLAGDVNPLVGVSGILVMRGPCFDAGSAFGNLRSQSVSPPFVAPSPSPSPSPS